MLLNLTIQDDRGEDLEVHCEINDRGNIAFWRAELYGASSTRGVLEGRVVTVEAVRGHIQAEVLLDKLRA
jgi:hypothetical protein